VYTNQGDYDRAEACYAEAAPIYQRLGGYAEEVYVSRGRGVVALKQGNHARAFDLLAETISVFQELGDKEYMLLNIERLAAVAKEQHRPDRAARLLSAGESLHKEIGVARSPVNQADYDACLASVRSQLGEAAFAVAWAEGSTMTLEQAVAYAADRSDQV